MKAHLMRVLIGLGLCAGVAACAAEEYAVVYENNVPMKTRDGVILYADIYRPKAEGKFPVLLERTCYDKYTNVDMGLKGASRGYVMILQDVRGRHMSGGEWYPFRHEANDGYDAVEWAAALPYANGKVGMIGGSYVGVPVMQAAVSAPPHLAGIAPMITASNYHAHWAYQGGAFMQMLAQAWSSVMSIDVASRRTMGSAIPSHWDYQRPSSAYPVIDVGTSKGVADYYFDWWAHPAYDDYWKQWSVEEQFGKVAVPALHFAAWYDLFQDGSIRNYTGIRAHGATEAARKGQRLVIMPGGHAGFGEKIGEIEFGKAALFDSWGYSLRFFDHLLKGIDNGFDREKPVKIFVMGRNVWRDEDEWPLARARTTRYYLHSGGQANSLAGDGSLSSVAPTREPADRYVSDPYRPVPTHGGPILGDLSTYPNGPLDQRKIEERPDVLVYTTAPFERDTEVTGPVSLELYISSTAADTDFAGKLVDVAPDGRAYNLTDGILRASFRNSMEKAEPLKPGEIHKVTVDLWSTANVFLAGHRLRLEVASANFPRFDRNPQNGGRDDGTKPFATATNTIYHDADHPSSLILPFVP